MKTILFALVLLTGCSTIAPVVNIQHTPQGPLVAQFEPSVPPPPSAHVEPTSTRSPAGVKSRRVKALSDAEILNLWSVVNREKKSPQDSLIRSNPSHFWAWMNKNLPENLQTFAEFQGQVVADPHYFNFADAHEGKNSGLAVVDVDDSGVGSLYLDFIRYAVFVKAYMKVSLTKELFDAYKDGLEQKDKKVPDFLKEPLSKSRKDLMAEHKQWVMKNLKADYKLDNKSLKIMGLKELEKKSPDKVKEAKDLAERLLKSGKASKVYDHGYSINDSGSSSGMDRYWFSLATPSNESSIYECKQFGQVATAYYTVQKHHAERVADVLDIYSDVKTTDSYVFSTPKASYWCRPKHFQFFDRDEVEENRTKLKPMTEYSRYLAYWMGLKQVAQPEGKNLLKAIEDSMKADKNQLLDDTIRLIDAYETEVFKNK